MCLEMLNFANYSGEADSKIVREIWIRLLDQALSRGGLAEACSVLKRVGSNLYPGDGACLPLDIICLHLEKAALVTFLLYLQNYFTSLKFTFDTIFGQVHSFLGKAGPIKLCFMKSNQPISNRN